MLISITGTESTGKTTLANQLARHYRAGLVPDISRMVVEGLQRPYDVGDIDQIGREIIKQEDLLLQQTNNGIIISDNCLFNIKIWLQYYNWPLPSWLVDSLKQRKSELYLLCDIDLDWIPDPQRQNPHDRGELLFRFMEEMATAGVNYKLVSGTGQQRLEHAIEQIDVFLNYRQV